MGWVLVEKKRMNSLQQNYPLTDPMENKQEWKVNVFFMVPFSLLKALVCTEVGMEKVCFLKCYWFLTSICFHVRIKSSSSCGLHLQGPGFLSDQSLQASLGFKWTWPVLERKLLCVFSLLDTLQSECLNGREIGFLAKSHFLPVARPLVSSLISQVQIRR